MKKMIIISSFLAFSLCSFAQDAATTSSSDAANSTDIKSKNGMNIKPEADEYALGFNAIPMFNYLGNTLNGNTFNGNMNAGFVNSGYSIYGKKFIDSSNAFRVRLGIQDSKTTYRNMVVQDGQIDPNVRVEDRMVATNSRYSINVGKEMRRGKGRVQGIYGAELGLSWGRYTEKYTYGNAMGGQFIAPNSTDFGSNIVDTNFPMNSYKEAVHTSDRTTYYNGGRNFMIGVNGFVGVEYFFAPKISIAAEYTLGLGYSVTGENTTTREVYTNDVTEETVTNVGNKGLGLATGNQGGAIAVMFHF